MRQTTMSHSFDTYKHIKALVAQGMNENQAELVVTTIVESRDFDLSKLVTREEFSEFKSYTREQFTKIESEIDLIKKDIDHIKETMATKDQIIELETKIDISVSRLETKIDTSMSRLETKIAETHASTLRWIIGTVIAFSSIVIAGLQLLKYKF